MTYEERQKSNREYYKRCVANRFNRLVSQLREDGYEDSRIFTMIIDDFGLVDGCCELLVLRDVMLQSS